MSSCFVIYHDLDGTWSVREKETGRCAVSRGNPVAGVSERVAALRSKKLNCMWLSERPHQSRSRSVDGFDVSGSKI